ncbi:MAG: hypothetical protein WBF42_17235, partial [Terracidiphilus sp.]
MNWLRNMTNRAEEPTAAEELDPHMKQALGDFKASVHAWSDAAGRRPRTVRNTVVHRTWRLAAGWGLAATLLVGTVSGGVYEHQRRVAEAQAAAAQQAEHQRELAAERARRQAQQEDDILASVDEDVAREVPSAMEP